MGPNIYSRYLEDLGLRRLPKKASYKQQKTTNGIISYSFPTVSPKNTSDFPTVFLPVSLPSLPHRSPSLLGPSGCGDLAFQVGFFEAAHRSRNSATSRGDLRGGNAADTKNTSPTLKGNQWLGGYPENLGMALEGFP